MQLSQRCMNFKIAVRERQVHCERGTVGGGYACQINSRSTFNHSTFSVMSILTVQSVSSCFTAELTY